MADWTPDLLGSALALWLDANDSSTITTDVSGNVEQWDDKSGNDAHFSQSTSSLRPSIGTVDSKDSVFFNGDRLEGNAAAKEIARDVDHIATYAVVSCSGAGTSGDLVLLFTLPTSESARYFAHLEDSVGVQVDGRRLDSDSYTSSSAYFIDPNDTPHVYQFVGDYSTATAVLGADGNTATDSSWLTAGNTSDTASQSAVIGMSMSGTVALFGDICEIVVCTKKLSASEEDKVIGYLSHKWGLEANLPGGHPYKSAAPTTTTNYDITLEAGSISLTGASLNLTYTPAPSGYTINLDAGTFSVTGADVNTTAQRKLSLGAGSISWSGEAVELVRGYNFSLSAGSFALSGAALTPARGATIVTQPTNVTVTQPGDAVFSVVAVHPQGRELTYQWYQEGVALAGETGTTLTVNSPGSAFDGYEYYVVVTDSVDGSTVASQTVVLTVQGADLEPMTMCIKRSHVAGTVPDVDDIIEGEVAMNTADRKLWIRDGSNNIVLLGGLQDGWLLPTSDPVDAGKFWNDSGTLKVSNG